MNERVNDRTEIRTAAMMAVVALALATASPAAASCEAQPSEAKWCGQATIPWTFGAGLSGSLTGTRLTIKLAITTAMSDLNTWLASSKVPLSLSGPGGGTGITFTYGQKALGTSSCSSGNALYAKTFTSYQLVPGGSINRMVSAQIDFNNQFSGWTSNLALTVTYHEMGHALGLGHVYAVPVGGCPVTGAPDPLMSEALACSAAPGIDALFEKGIRCLYGPDGTALEGVTTYVTAGGGTRTVRSKCSGVSNCTSSSSGLTTQGARTYDLALSTNGGPFVSFATLGEGDWVDNAYEHVFAEAHENARIRMEVRDGAIVIASPLSDLVNIPAPVTGIEPGAGSPLVFLARPNPFDTAVQLRLEMAFAAVARVTVTDVTGRLVRRLYEGPLDAGPHEFAWDGRNERGDLVSRGVFYAEAIAGGRRATRALIRAP